MSNEIISNARALLESSQAEEALELLAPIFESNQENVRFLQIFGETLLENNDVETAYDVLVKACKLDANADAGTEKFFYLGQIIGGDDGLKSLDIGLNKLNKQLLGELANDEVLMELAKLYPSPEQLKKYLVKKMNQGIFAKIEIWMTDLCMEEVAENKCNELIEYSLSLDPQNPEALSLLSSIRISQQRTDEAKEALVNSWKFFQIKKVQLEEAANNKEGEDSFEVGVEYVELIQPLLTLARFAIELELYQEAVGISSNVTDINDNVLEAYYYESLAHLFSAKQLVENSECEDYRDIQIDTLKTSSNSDIINLLTEAKSTLTLAYKVINSESADADADLIEQIQSLLSELGGPIMSELMPQRNIDEEGWEEEIYSEDE
jgi:tetratricopeptide (TPR) repeat protein